MNKSRRNNYSKSSQIKKQLREVFLIIVFFWLLSIFVSKQITMNDVYVGFSLISLWSVFEFVIRISEAAEKLENAKTYPEFFSAFASLLWILLKEYIMNRIVDLLKRLYKKLR